MGHANYMAYLSARYRNGVPIGTLPLWRTYGARYRYGVPIGTLPMARMGLLVKTSNFRFYEGRKSELQDDLG